MTVPLMILAAGAVVAGFVGIPGALGGANHIEHFLAPSFEARPLEGHATATAGPSHEATPAGGHGLAAAVGDAAHGEVPAAKAHAPSEGHGEGEAHLSRGVELGLMLFSVVVAVIGIGWAWRSYVTRPGLAARRAERFPRLYRLLYNKYFVDELYHATAVRGVMASAWASWRFDANVVDGLVNGSAWVTKITAWLSGVLDRTVVDGAVNGTAASFREASHGFRRLQTGLVQNYALLMMVGVFAFVSVYLLLR
jgi:NADH-quinone oxidoreductase subunit L